VTPPHGVQDLLRLARRARRRAHAPYSRFAVGAALRTRRGEIVTGCNVENASYGLAICAERVAAFKAVSEGLRRFDALAVVVDATTFAAPCGACRQVLWELCGDVWVHLATLTGAPLSLRLSELLPLPFELAGRPSVRR
jgi:cytidine deaminase